MVVRKGHAYLKKAEAKSSQLQVCSHQTFVGLEDVLKPSSRHVLKTSSRHVLKTTSTHFQRNNITSSKASWRRLQDVLEDKKPSRWRHLEDISWRCLEDTMERDKILTGDLTNLNVYLTNLYFTNLYLAILRRIQNALIRTQ